MIERTQLRILYFVIGSMCATPAFCDNYSSPAQRWSGNWSYPSFNERSVALSQAQIIRQAEQGASPSTVVTNNAVYDNRAGYIETYTGDGATLSGGTQIGDAIGQNTNSIGAMNTGNTQIDINGNSNVIDAVNAADSSGCVDGSISSSSNNVPSSAASQGIDISIGGTSVGSSRCN